MSKPLTGKIAWVTGSARGIGKSIARLLASEGAYLALTDVLAEDLEKTAREFTDEFGIRVVQQILDVTDRDGATAFVQRVTEELGGLTILINNAGITRDGLLMRMSASDWERVINVNLTGTFVCTQAAIKPMMPNAVSSPAARTKPEMAAPTPSPVSGIRWPSKNSSIPTRSALRPG